MASFNGYVYIGAVLLVLALKGLILDIPGAEFSQSKADRNSGNCLVAHAYY